MERLNYLPVNWVDGMKISKQHFLDMENYLLDQVRDSNSLTLNDFNFGLLPAPESGRESISLDISSERVELYYCRAVTRAGTRIEIIDLEESNLRRSIRQLMGDFEFSQSKEWYVVVRVNPYERVPYGRPAPDTTPIRHLNAIPRYELGIIPKDQTSSSKIAGYALPIAKIRGGVGGVEQVKNYIPPCARVNSSMEIVRSQQKWEQDLSAILKESVIIVRKVNYRKSRETVSSLANDICEVAAKTMEFLNNNYDAYRLIIPNQPPLLLIEYFARLARTVDTSLELTRGKDDMLNYFQQYVQNFRYSDFNGTLQALTTNLIYNHFELREMLDKVEQFVAQLKNLVEGLGRLNYERLPSWDPVTSTRQMSPGGMNQPVPPSPRQDSGSGGITIKPPHGRDPRRDDDGGGNSWNLNP